MKLNFGPIMDWFGFTRRERRSSLILLILVACVLFFHYAIPLSVTELKEINDASFINSDSAKSYDSDQPDTSNVKYFKKDRYQSAGGKSIGSGKDSEVKHIAEYYARNHSSYRNEKTELNSSDSAMLEHLPGIGPVLAARIIKYRNLLGGFYTVAQLKEVYGLDTVTFASIRERIIVDTSKIIRINVNNATYRELARFPYIGRVDAAAVLKYRDLEGHINNIDELVKNNVLSGEKKDRLGHYVVFE